MAGAEFYTYVHRRNDTGEVFYVGKGSGKRAYDKSARSEYWKRIAAKHGVTVDIVDRFETEQKSFKSEIALIHLFSVSGLRLINMTQGGEGCRGAKRSEETKLKMSLAMKARPPHVVSEETRKKMSASAVGRRMSIEAIEKTAAAHRGMKRSQKTLDLMSAALKGKKMPPRSQETRDKLAAGRLGKVHSEETKRQMSLSRTGKKKRPQSAEHKAKLSAARKKYWRDLKELKEAANQ